MDGIEDQQTSINKQATGFNPADSGKIYSYIDTTRFPSPIWTPDHQHYRKWSLSLLLFSSMTTFTTPTTIAFHPFFAFPKVQDIPSVLHSSISPSETSWSTHGHGVGGLSYIISYHIIYPLPSTDRNLANYMNESKRASLPPALFLFFIPAVGLTSLFCFSFMRTGIAGRRWRIPKKSIRVFGD